MLKDLIEPILEIGYEILDLLFEFDENYKIIEVKECEKRKIKSIN